jgi:hypothetical protein
VHRTLLHLDIVSISISLTLRSSLIEQPVIIDVSIQSYIRDQPATSKKRNSDRLVTWLESFRLRMWLGKANTR